MKVFKFGGASVKDAKAVKNLADIVKMNSDPLIVVVSAMGKSTNKLEELLKAYYNRSEEVRLIVKDLQDYHYTIVEHLFMDDDLVYDQLGELFNKMEVKLKSEPSMNYNFEYDQIVSFGELISTTIINAYLCSQHYNSTWVDIRNVLKTDENYREANVLFELSQECAKDVFVTKDSCCYITQGFIGASQNNHTTTLGREGSDYTAALLASYTESSSVTVWKDVPGVLNADPKWFDDTVKLDFLSYTDAVELAFYGASVLHPKTIQPVMRKSIPLHVKSFLDPKSAGTVIGDMKYDKLIPSFIFKINQVLMNIHPHDLSFIAEDNLERIFGVLAKFSLKVNLMQNTAVSFRICINNDTTRIPAVVYELSKHYRISLNENLELITIRYYDQQTINRVLTDKVVLLEQHSHKTVQMVVKKLE